MPRPDPDHPLALGAIRGEIGSALAPPPGCRFHPRCPQAIPDCAGRAPAATALSPGHWAACYLLDPLPVARQPEPTA